MGKVWLDTSEVGGFEPQYVGTSGIIFLSGIYVGSFSALTATGDVYLDSADVGDYTALGAPPPPPPLPPVSEMQDARYRTRTYLNYYLDAPSLTKDDDVTQASYVVIYANPDYPLTREFNDLGVDVIFCVGTPDSEALHSTA